MPVNACAQKLQEELEEVISCLPTSHENISLKSQDIKRISRRSNIATSNAFSVYELTVPELASFMEYKC